MMFKSMIDMTNEDKIKFAGALVRVTGLLGVTIVGMLGIAGATTILAEAVESIEKKAG